METPAEADDCDGGEKEEESSNGEEKEEEEASVSNPLLEEPKNQEEGSDGASQASDKAAGSAAASPSSSPRAIPKESQQPRLHTTPQMRQAVLEALAVAPTRMKQAPHGILKGRIKYYQKQGTRWRMEVEDVRIRRRVPLRKIRRKQEKPSLWDLSRECRQGKDPPLSSDSEPSKWTFELLAYDDIP